MIRHHPPLHRVIIGRIVQALLIIIAGYIIGVAIFSSKVFGALQQNVASQKLYIYDYDTTNNVPKTGDSANITVYRSLDGGTATAISGNPTELSSANAPGVYIVSPSQADTNGNYIAFTATSTSTGCKIDPLFVSTDNATIGSRGTSNLSQAQVSGYAGPILTDNSTGLVTANATKIGGTSQTGRDLGASVLVSVGTGSGQINVASGKVPATVNATDVTGNVAADIQTIKTQVVTAATGVTFPTSIGTSTLAAGAQMDLVNAPNATAITAIQLGLSKPGTAQTITFPTNPSVNVAQWATVNVTGMPLPTGSYTTPPTVSQIATATWQDLTSSSDFTGVGSIGKLLTTDLDTNVSSRMATYVQPTGFLGASFPSTIASPTNITAGTITTVTTTTNLTNLPSIPANWITAAGITAGALNGKGDWLLSSGYTAPPSSATITSAVAAQITTDHGTGSYIRNTEPDNADIGNIAKSGTVVGSDFVFSSNALANAPSSGGGFTGSKSCTLTFNDANGNPVGNVGFAVSGTGATATAGGGSIAVGLNPGTYTVTPSPQSGTMWTPTAITVTSASTQTFSFNGTSIVIPPASDPGACNVSLKFLNPDLSPAAGRPITLIMTQAPPGNGTGYITTGTPLKVTTGSDGTVLVPLPRLSHYSISAPPSLTTPLIVPDQPAYSPNNIRL